MEVYPPQYAMLSCPADFVLFGGAVSGGKSWALCLDPLRHVRSDIPNPDFRGALFRKTYPQLTQAGGLLDTTRKIYPQLGAIFNQTRSTWTFPSGAQISLNTLQYERDVEQYLGSQWDWCGIDECAAFSLDNIMFLWSRCRSRSGVKPTMRLTANPDNASFLFPMIQWWLDPETGYPNTAKSGVIRHFTMVDEKFSWSDDPVVDENGAVISTSMTFIPSKLTDNLHMMKNDPAYYRRLLNMKTQDRERFLEGSWLASSGGNVEWPRELFVGLFVPFDHFPVQHHANEHVRVFGIDASKGKSTKAGDYSAIVSVTQTKDLKYVDASIARRPPGQIIEDLFQYCDQEHHRIRAGDLIGIEALQFQSLFIDMIMTYAKDHPEYALSGYLKSGGFIIPVIDMLNKQMRIRRLDTSIRNREFRFLENPSTVMLLNQLKTFNGQNEKGVFDDGADALAQSLQMPRYLNEYYEDLRKKK